jgi:hypothetical protein
MDGIPHPSQMGGRVGDICPNPFIGYLGSRITLRRWRVERMP